MTRIIGKVAGLTRFPVKSMAGEPLEVADLDWQGIEGDRQYAFVRAENATRFPWLTAREVSDLVRHGARFADPTAPRTSRILVDLPGGGQFVLDDPRLRARLEAAAGEPLALIQSARGIYDSMPVSIQTSAGHARVEAEHGGALDLRRFRTNVLIESDEFPESWARRRLVFESGAAMLCSAPIPRCAIVTIDPDTATRAPRVLRTIAQRLDNAYGIYANPARPGMITVGDAVRLLD